MSDPRGPEPAAAGAGLIALGVSHKTAPLALRERLALPEGRASGILSELVRSEAIHEAVALSTCNRTELYLLAADPVEAESAALTTLARQAGIPPTELFGRLYAIRGLEAVHHLFEVAGGLDSMIVGEAEIQGQVKRAYELALVEGVTGPLTNRLFRDALAAGKRVRTETAVGRSRVSVASVAVELAREVLGDLARRRVLVIGAGENGELTARALARRGVQSVIVTNRRYERAVVLAERFGGTAIGFDELADELARSDIVVTSTSSPHQIIGHENLSRAMEARAGRPLLLIDIAVPRDIDPQVRDLPGVSLYDMDDLEREIVRDQSGHQAEISRARSIVREEVERFESWLQGLDVVPTITALRERGEAIVAQLLRENEGRWESLSEDDRERVALLARSVASRLLHEPTLAIKRPARDGDPHQLTQAVRDLFGLDTAAHDDGHVAEVASLEARRSSRGA